MKGSLFIVRPLGIIVAIYFNTFRDLFWYCAPDVHGSGGGGGGKRIDYRRI